MSDYSALFHLSALILLYLEGMENVVLNLLGSVGNKQPLCSRGGTREGNAGTSRPALDASETQILVQENISWAG